MFGYRSNVPRMRLTTNRLVVRLVHDRDVWRLVDYCTKNRHFSRLWEPACDESYCYPSGWWTRLGMINEFHKQGSAFHFSLFNPDKREIAGAVGFSNVVRGFFHVYYLGYSIGQRWQGKGLVFKTLSTAIHYMQRTQHIHHIMANYTPHNKHNDDLLVRLGFEEGSYTKGYLPIDEQWRDRMLMALTTLS